MVEKDRRRALRRQRSYTKFMGRLKRDWNDHGWARDPDGREHCPCFWDPKAQSRFKDTPKPVSCLCCSNQRRWGKGNERLTIEERRVFQPEEVIRRGGHRHEGTHPFKVLCSRCGYLLKVVKATNRKPVPERYGQRCDGCRKRGV